jgi:hypothetical protein
MTDTTLNFRRAIFSQETGRIAICLVTITHESLSEPIYLSADPTMRLPELTTASDVVYGTISRGRNYLYYPMSITLPNDTDEGGNEITVTIDNVRRELTEIIRTIQTPPVFLLEIVMDNALDVVEFQWPEYRLANITYNAQTITGTLSLETLVNEPFPVGAFTPAGFPGIF